MKKLLIGITLAAIASVALAKDYGVQGNQWPVTELDMRMMLITEAAGKDWSKYNGEVKDSAEHYLDNLPKRTLPIAERTHTVWFDPSIELSSDIQVPAKQANGNFAWNVMYPKGTRVNPLKTNRPLTAMLFFDGSQQDQVKFVEDLLVKEPNRIQVVEAGSGSVQQLNTKLKRPVFYANDALISRFQIKELPTLLYAGDGEHELFLGITSFGMPYDVNQAMQAWAPLRPAVTPTPIKKPQ